MSLERFQDRWHELDRLFQQACDLPREQLEAFCTEAGGDDPEFGRFLYELVTAAEGDDARVRDSISDVAHDVTSGGGLEGERAGVWLVGKLLARGGMGEVYLATRAYSQFDEIAILKVMRFRLNKTEFVRHFESERQVHAALSHPYIPELLDAGQLEDGRPYLVAQFVDGVAIDEYCASHSLSVAERIKLVEHVCKAVQHAHANLVLHLDIKPSSILIEKDGIPRLLDFGVSRLLGQAEEGHDSFTPVYASPEQLTQETPTAASDVYAIGGLLYCLIEKEPPFTADRQAPAKTQLADREAVANKLKRTMIPTRADRELRAIILKAMAIDPAERYHSIAALLQDLDDYRNNVPVSAIQPTVAYRTAKFVRRNIVLLSVAGALVALLAVFAVRGA
ncbi:MAG: serine/threonine-protein kinase [Pseudomonadota bacterium]